MSSVNKVILVGRLGRDPEVRQTQGGQAVANFTLATDETWKDSQGTKQKRTEWHKLVVWGKTVENFVQPYLHKGDQIYVEGKIQSREWEDKEQVKRVSFEINVTDIKMIQSLNQDSNAKPAAREKNSTARPASRPVQQQDEPEPESISDEDIPF